jgi:hypothetical protein
MGIRNLIKFDLLILIKLIEYRNRDNTEIEVRVKYPNKQHVTNGGTEENK